MKKAEKWLGGLLVAQLVFATALLWADQAGQNQRAPEQLLALEAADVSRIELDGEEQSLTLERRQDQWVLPEHHELPVEQERVARLLERVAGLKAGWPVSTSQDSHERFEVAEEKYQRRLRLYQGEELLGDLFLGTSPGLRQVHLRRAGEDAVYSGELPVYDMPLVADDWLDKNLLALDNISSIKGQEFSLKKQDSTWTFADSDRPIAQNKVLDLASALTSLRVTGLAESAPEEVDEEIELSVEADGKTYEYRFLKKGTDYYISRADLKPVFTWTSGSYERLAGITRETLTAEPPSEVATKETETEQS